MAKNTTTTMKGDIYAFVFGQKGLMAGLIRATNHEDHAGKVAVIGGTGL